MGYHSIRIAGKKIETYDDFEYEELSTNKDFFEEIFFTNTRSQQKK